MKDIVKTFQSTGFSDCDDRDLDNLNQYILMIRALFDDRAEYV